MRLSVLVSWPVKSLLLIDLFFSALVSAVSIESMRTVSYAAVPGIPLSQTSLDLYPCSAEANHLVLYVHGGGWTGGDKKNIFMMPSLFNDRGLCFASANYPLMSGDDGVTIIDQQLNALRLFNEWIDHSMVSGKPPQRVSIIAHSSGAHLVALFDKRFGWSNSVNHLVLLDSASYDLYSRYRSASQRYQERINLVLGTSNLNITLSEKELKMKEVSPALLEAKDRDLSRLRILLLSSFRPAKANSAYVLKESYADSSGYEVETKSLSLTHRAFIRDLGLNNAYTDIVLNWILGS